MQKEVIYLGADHAGFALKEYLKSFLAQCKYVLHDVGALVYDKDDDYPNYAEKVAKGVQKSKNAKGILVCGSAQGVCIAANKFRHIRAVAVNNEQEAKLTREHNDANILCLAGGGMIKKVKGIGLSAKQAEHIVLTFLTTPFNNEARHKRRIQKIMRFEH